MNPVMLAALYPSAGVRRKAPAGLGRHHDRLLALALQLRDQALAAPHAVDVGGIDEVDAAVDGLVQRGQRLVVIHVAHTSRRCPRAKLISDTFQPVRPSSR